MNEIEQLIMQAMAGQTPPMAQGPAMHGVEGVPTPKMRSGGNYMSQMNDMVANQPMAGATQTIPTTPMDGMDPQAAMMVEQLMQLIMGAPPMEMKQRANGNLPNSVEDRVTRGDKNRRKSERDRGDDGDY